MFRKFTWLAIVLLMMLGGSIPSAAFAQGKLNALYDPQIATALGCIHRYPNYTWTVEKLAEEVNMSRSGFAALFSDLVGEPP